MRITTGADVLAHPKTRRLAALLGTTVPAAAGHLLGLWGGAAGETEDGDLSDTTPALLAAWCEWTGDPDVLLAALLGCAVRPSGGGYLDRGADGRLCVHAWHEHEARERARADGSRERMRRRRAERAAKANAPPPAARTRPRATEKPHVERQERAKTRALAVAPHPDAAPADAPGTNGKHNKGKELLDLLSAAGVRVGMTGQDFKALKDTDLTPADVAEVYLAIYSGDFGDQFTSDRLTVATAIRAWNGYQAARARRANGVRPAAATRGPAYAAATWTPPQPLERRIS